MATETAKSPDQAASDAEKTQVLPPRADPPEGIRRLGEEPPKDVIDDAAAGKRLSPTETVDALDWLLGDADDDDEFTQSLEINVGPPGRDLWTRWIVRPLDADEIRSIQNAGVNRAQRRRGSSGDLDLAEQNRRIVLMGTVVPDLRAVAMQKNVADPGIVLKHRFRHKPLLLDQLAAEILTLSGADDEAIRDAREVRAAGN